MKRYELVKEYPGSPELGTIAVAFKNGYRVLDSDGNIISFFNDEDGSFMEHWSEFWKDADRDKRTMLERITEFLDSPEGEESIQRFGEKLEREERQKTRDYERFVRMVEHNGLENLMDKITHKYDSDEYARRELKMGYEPRETLSYVIYKYFTKNGEQTEDGINDFMTGNYRIGSYVVGLMIGQGSYVKIQKI